MRALYILRRFVEGVGSLVSRTFNAAVVPGGSTAQTTSAHAHVNPKLRRLRRVINAVAFWQDDHCAAAWAYEVERAERTLELNRMRAPANG